MITNPTETIYAAQELSAERARTNAVLDFGSLLTEPNPQYIGIGVVAMLTKIGLRAQAAWQPFSRWFRQCCLTYPYNLVRNF